MWRIKQTGVTLLEMMLVLVVISAIILMILGYTTQKASEFRRDKVSLQMQQILNAGLAYYTNHSIWPGSISTLVNGKYLLANMKNPWGNNFSLPGGANANTFTVETDVGSNAEAQAVASRLPMGASAGNRVAAMVNIPGQNLNNARSVNFSSVYHNGACVLAPTCPGNMKPQIFVVPVSVSGVNQKNTDATKPDVVNPISSFSAYAIGDFYSPPDNPNRPGKATDIKSCKDLTKVACERTMGTLFPDTDQGRYWRVCLKVMTDIGDVSATNPDAGGKVSVMAITRCAPPGEPTGSDFTVYQ